MIKPLIEKLDLDDVLVKFKVYGRYHGVAGVILTLGAMFETMTYCNYVFVTEDVKYRCAESSLESGNFSSSRVPWCRNPASCSKWVYDNPDSFVAEFELACQDWKRTLVGSAHSIGYMAGLLIVGPLSDRFGRKSLILITGIAGSILGTAKSFATSYWLYVALESLEAAIGDVCSPLYMLALEMVASKSRVTYSTICNMGYGLGGLMVPLMAWLIPYWRTLLRATYAPGLLFVFLIYFVDESPRWLLAKGKKSEAVDIIRKAAKINKIEIKENLNMIHFENDNQSGFVTVIRDTFKSKSLLKRVFVCTVWWMACTLVNHGLSLNSVILEGNKYVNFALSSAMELFSNCIMAYILAKFKRRGPLIVTFVACAALCIGQPFIPNALLWLVISTYMTGKLISSITFNTVYIFTSELFPTNSRNSMHALCSSIGRIGSIIAPQMPLLMVYWAGLPTVIFGLVSLVAGLVTFLVPDTAEHSLPDTVGQAEAIEINSLEIMATECRVTYTGYVQQGFWFRRDIDRCDGLACTLLENLAETGIRAQSTPSPSNLILGREPTVASSQREENSSGEDTTECC